MWSELWDELWSWITNFKKLININFEGILKKKKNTSIDEMFNRFEIYFASHL